MFVQRYKGEGKELKPLLLRPPSLFRSLEHMCSCRKLGIQVEDETQTLLLRLSDAMCGELFGMDAKAFKKLAQTSPDQVQDIQVKTLQNAKIQRLHTSTPCVLDSMPQYKSYARLRGSPQRDTRSW